MLEIVRAEPGCAPTSTRGTLQAMKNSTTATRTAERTTVSAAMISLQKVGSLELSTVSSMLPALAGRLARTLVKTGGLLTVSTAALMVFAGCTGVTFFICAHLAASF